MMDNDYYIQRLNTSNIADVEQLHTAVYKKKPALNYFGKKYNTAYTGVQYVGFLAYKTDGNIPIAYYGVIPCFISYAGETVLSAQSADTMTHPQYRYKGIFVELANCTYQLCRELGIRLVFGFPNQNSVHGFVNKLNWRMTETMNRFHIQIPALPLEKITAKNKLLKKVYDFYIQQVLKPVLFTDNGIAGTLSNEGFGGVLRNKDYLRYKTYSATQVIKLGLSTIWFKINNGLIIGDILVEDEYFDECLKRLISLAKRLGLRQIAFQSSISTRLNNLFEKRFKAVPSFPVIFLDLESGLPLEWIKFTFADIDIF